ncbi:unnamed protein product, partial [Allacma fusca]
MVPVWISSKVQVTSFKCIQMILKTAREMSSFFPSMGSKCIVINCPAF